MFGNFILVGIYFTTWPPETITITNTVQVLSFSRLVDPCENHGNTPREPNKSHPDLIKSAGV